MSSTDDPDDVPTPYSAEDEPVKARSKKKAKQRGPKPKAKAPTKRREVPQAVPPLAAPVVRTKKKTEDRNVHRFKNLLPDVDLLTEQILASDLDHTKAIEVTTKVDDMVDWAPNVITFCADRRFLGMRPFARQAEMLIKLFEAACPRCSDPDYMQEFPVKDSIEQVLAKVALLDFNKCPHCGWTKADGRLERAIVDPLELVAVLGQRAGKSAVCSMGISYLIHRVMSIGTPWKTFGLTPGQVVDFTVVATTMAQAQNTLWSTFKGMFTESAWFKNYRALANEEGRKAGIKETVQVSETFIWMEHKRMMAYFAANNPSSLRGTTRFGAAIDELAWFDNSDKSGKVRANGPETYAALNNACMTLRTAVDAEIERNPATNWPVPIMFDISSPREMNDPIMTLYRERSGDKRCIRSHRPTWEVNPHLTKKKLARELATATGPRDFGAQPPMADDPLIKRTDTVVDAFKSPLAIEKRYGPILVPSAEGFIDDLDVKAGKSRVHYLTAALDDEYQPKPPPSISSEDLEALGPLQDLFTELLAKPAKDRPHVMGVDLGTTTNAMAVVCGYLAEDNSKFVTDFALETKPTKGRPVHIADAYENLIVPLVKKLNVVSVYYDRWSSLHHVQDLASRFGSLGPLNSGNERRAWLRELRDQDKLPDFYAGQYSLTMADAVMLVSRLEQGDLLFPAAEVPVLDLLVDKSLDPSDYPYAHLALQLCTIRARGNRLLKPIHGDDDLFRAWANCAVKALTDELTIDLLSQDTKAKTQHHDPIRGYVSRASYGKGVQRIEANIGGALSPSGQTALVVHKRGTMRG